VGDASARISSNRSAPAVSVEGGLKVVTGRVQLANAFGSELLRLPVRLTAQYWTGSVWENNGDDSDSALPASATFTSCKGKLVCGALVPQNPVTLVDGAGTMWLQAPGAGNTGSAFMQLANTPPWLPSTIGRVTFGVYKSRFIYIREVY
jgi:hypothetical protein